MVDVSQQVIEIISKRIGDKRDKLDMDAKLKDLGVESLGAVELIFDLEEKFDIQIPFNANDAELADFETVGDVVRAVEDLVAAKGSIKA